MRKFTRSRRAKANQSERAPSQPPTSVSQEADGAMRRLMSDVLAAIPSGMEETMPTPLNVHFLSEEGTGRWMSLFTLANPSESGNENVMRVEAGMDMVTMRRVAAEGQEPMWEWMRNVAAMTCVQALLHGQELPNRIGIQLSDAIRAHDIDRDPEFVRHLNLIAKQEAMRTMMARTVSE